MPNSISSHRQLNHQRREIPHQRSAALPGSEEHRQERSGLTRTLLRDAAGTPDPQRRQALLARVVELNRPVAVAVASRYRNRGVDFEDLCQTGYEGLTKAVQRFDPALADDLLTYAVPTIRGEIQRLFRETAWAVRPPRRLQELHKQLSVAHHTLLQANGREPTRAELAQHLEIGVAELDEADAAQRCFESVSLDGPTSTGSRGPRQLSELVAVGLEQEYEAAEARAMIMPAVRALRERDRRIVYLRYFEGWTQAEIGREIGVSQMQVSRLLSRILLDLRAAVDGLRAQRGRNGQGRDVDIA